MTDIVQFINDRLAEDQAAAEYDQQQRDAGGEVRYASGSDFTPALGRLMLDARFNPARVLAEVAAKREHLELWRDAWERRDRALKLAESEQPLMQKAAISVRAEANGLCEALGRILLLDARIYAAHPDYDPGWRPE